MAWAPPALWARTWSACHAVPSTLPPQMWQRLPVEAKMRRRWWLVNRDLRIGIDRRSACRFRRALRSSQSLVLRFAGVTASSTAINVATVNPFADSLLRKEPNGDPEVLDPRKLRTVCAQRAKASTRTRPRGAAEGNRATRGDAWRRNGRGARGLRGCLRLRADAANQARQESPSCVYLENDPQPRHHSGGRASGDAEGRNIGLSVACGEWA